MEQNRKCDYGCGKEAKYQFKNGKWCCCRHHSSCEAVKNKRPSNLTEVHKSKIRKSMKSKEIRKKISRANTGEQNPNWKGGYDKKGIPRYDNYAYKISYAEPVRRYLKDPNILEVKCAYCGNWFVPTRSAIFERIYCLTNDNIYGVSKLYCSDNCKSECPIFNQTLYPKGFKIISSREVQPELRQMRFKIDNYTCQKCGKHQDELKIGLHCHHIEGIRWEPLESADLDKVITLCKDCHKKVHKIEGCGYHDMQCKNKEENYEMVS